MPQQVLIAQPLTAARSRGLSGRLRPPADRLIGLMALMLAAVSRGDSLLEGLGEGADDRAAIDAIGAMGVAVERTDDGHKVSGLGALGLLEPRAMLDFSAAPTALWLTLGMVAPHSFASRFAGSDLPPTGPVVEALRALGADVQEQRSGHMPVALRGPVTGVPFVYRLPVGSTEVKAALLLAALGLPGVSSLIEVTPTPDHAERLCAHFGVDIKLGYWADGSPSIEIAGLPRLDAQTIALAADPELTAFPIVASLIVLGSDVMIENVLMHPARTALVDVLRQMGADIEVLEQRLSGGEEVADLRVRHSRLSATAIPATLVPLAVIPALAIAAAFAEGETRIGIGRTAAEGDMVALLVDGLLANGIAARRDGAALVITGGDPMAKLGGGTVTVGGNGFVAMAFLIMGLATTEAITIDDDRPIAGIYPGFRAALHALGADFYKRWTK